MKVEDKRRSGPNCCLPAYSQTPELVYLASGLSCKIVCTQQPFPSSQRKQVLPTFYSSLLQTVLKQGVYVWDRVLCPYMTVWGLPCPFLLLTDVGDFPGDLWMAFASPQSILVNSNLGVNKICLPLMSQVKVLVWHLCFVHGEVRRAVYFYGSAYLTAALISASTLILICNWLHL